MTKRAILFVPGGPGLESESFLPWVSPLAQDFNLVFEDVYGVHLDRSVRGGMEECLRRLQRAIKGFEAPVICAHSWGAIVVCEAIKQGILPQDIALILVCPAPITHEALRIASQQFARTIPHSYIRDFTRKIAAGGNHPDIMEKLLPYYCYDIETPPPIAFKTYDLDVFKKVSQEVEGFDYRDLQFPKTLKISAVADQFFDGIEAYPGTLQLIPDAKHYPFVEQSEKFCQIIRDWLL